MDLELILYLAEGGRILERVNSGVQPTAYLTNSTTRPNLPSPPSDFSPILPPQLSYCVHFFSIFTMPNGISKRQQLRNEKTLAELIRTVPGNDRCADCDALTPGSYSP